MSSGPPFESPEAGWAVAGLLMSRSEVCPFDPAEMLIRLRSQRPLVRVSHPDGTAGWLVTSQSLARAVLADERFSARTDLMNLPLPGAPAPGQMPPPQPGMFPDMDPPDHTRYRRLLIGRFTVRRMRTLTARVEHIVADHLDAMARHGGPQDLMTAYARPVPALVICELLGVPYTDQEQFREHALVLTGITATTDARLAAMTGLRSYLSKLMIAKKSQPTDDLLSELITTDLAHDELVNVAIVLLSAGLDTTANMIGLGAFALLQNPDQVPRLASAGAVDELLRYLSIIAFTVRCALVDVELGGQLITAGETVSLSLQAANRDPDHWPDPDVLDLVRPPAGHLAFGHGIHQCLGQQLARVELQIALPALFDRFPALHLTEPAQSVPMRDHASIYGVTRLSVGW